MDTVPSKSQSPSRIRRLLSVVLMLVISCAAGACATYGYLIATDHARAVNYGAGWVAWVYVNQDGTFRLADKPDDSNTDLGFIYFDEFVRSWHTRLSPWTETHRRMFQFWPNDRRVGGQVPASDMPNEATLRTLMSAHLRAIGDGGMAPAVFLPDEGYETIVWSGVLCNLTLFTGVGWLIVMPLRWFWKSVLNFPARRRAFLLSHHQCPKCRYDIRLLPDPRCPECGETWTEAELAAAIVSESESATPS